MLERELARCHLLFFHPSGLLMERRQSPWQPRSRGGRGELQPRTWCCLDAWNRCKRKRERRRHSESRSTRPIEYLNEEKGKEREGEIEFIPRPKGEA